MPSARFDEREQIDFVSCPVAIVEVAYGVKFPFVALSPML